MTKRLIEFRFLSTLSLRRATINRGTYHIKRHISIHALLAESDNLHPGYCALIHLFLSTLSLRRATVKISKNLTDRKNFYPRSPCGERHERFKAQMSKFLFLSTLSLRRATPTLHNIFKLLPFLSTLSLRRATLNAHLYYHSRGLFLSTLSLRRATKSLLTSVVNSTDFYPRSPCGERRCVKRCQAVDISISIHALLAESDSITITITCIVSRFLSTLSLRRATRGSIW